MTDLGGSVRTAPVLVLTPEASAVAAERLVAEEAPVAIEVDGIGYAVMMMTPADLPAFATGFILTERLADHATDILDIDVFQAEAGTIVRVALSERCRGRIHERVRHRSSDTSCGLCGLSGLEQLRRPVPGRPPRPDVAVPALFAALGRLGDHQPLTRATGAAHAAAACDAMGRVMTAFEDVGRHNALDKLIGAMALAGISPAFILVTSRISFEMVDKALVARVPLLVGISAPTGLALDHAREHGLTLVALARSDTMLAINDPWRVFGDL